MDFQFFQRHDNLPTHCVEISWKDVTESAVTHPFFVEAREPGSPKVRVLRTPEDLDMFERTHAYAAVRAPMPEALPDANLKTRAAVGKPRMSGVPPVALHALGEAFQDGVKKYGRFNWRDDRATSSVFYDAMNRHLQLWYAGENHATDSGLHHLAHLMAGAAILIDAELHGALNDDRRESGIQGDLFRAWDAVVKKG
jgi:hypothetical protein